MSNDRSRTKPPADAAEPSPVDASTAEAVSIDLQRTKTIPNWVKEVIATHAAIEQEDARSAGALGFMHRALVNTAMPYKDPKSRIFERVNGTFRLTIMAGYSGGIPFGVYPRLLMSWVSTEVVRTKSPELELGESLASFLRDVLDLQRGGGSRGSSTRVTEQMKRLFGAQITAQDSGKPGGRRFTLRNMSVVNEVDLDEDDFERRLSADDELHAEGEAGEAVRLWTPQTAREQGWKSRVLLSDYFYKEIMDSPVPIDLRAYRVLRGSPLAMDVYTWLTYRMSYIQRRSKPIRWEALMAQFGSNFTSEQAVRDFKKGFLKALKLVQVVYPDAKVEIHDNGLVLLPSRPHIPTLPRQPELF